MIVHDDWFRCLKTSAKSSAHEVDDPGVSEPASDVEALNREFSDHEETKSTSELCSGGIVGPVEVTLIDWSGHNIVHFVSLEPGSQLLQLTGQLITISIS